MNNKTKQHLLSEQTSDVILDRIFTFGVAGCAVSLISGIIITLLTAENEQNKHINGLSDEEILRRDTVLTEAEIYKKTHQYEIDTENVPAEHRVLAQQMIQEGHFTSPDYQHKIHKKAQKIKEKQKTNQPMPPSDRKTTTHLNHHPVRIAHCPQKYRLHHLQHRG